MAKDPSPFHSRSNLSLFLRRYVEYHLTLCRHIRPIRRWAPTGLRELLLLRPLQHVFEIAALMPRIEVRIRTWVVLDPAVGNDTHIRMTHDGLAQHFDAVALVRFDRGRQVGKLDKCVRRRWRIVCGCEGFAEEVLWKGLV